MEECSLTLGISLHAEQHQTNFAFANLLRDSDSSACVPQGENL